MIRIHFQEPQSTVWTRWIHDCEDATNDLKNNYKRGAPIEITELYRRKSVKQDVYFAKTGPFRGKCAYCESYITDFQHGDIEHFRPKKTVTDENDLPVTVTEADGKTSRHPGYYWLAYNWRNLLPSCIRCNQPGEEGIGKRNRFPLENPPPHAISEKEIPGEKPLLINPIDPGDDDPEKHLGIDLETGLMTFKNNSKRGKMCIDIFGLNKRDQLVQERKTAITEVKAKYVALLMLDDAQAQVIREEITAMEKGALNYTLARRAQIQKFRERLGL